jgi:hypothetical protein
MYDELTNSQIGSQIRAKAKVLKIKMKAIANREEIPIRTLHKWLSGQHLQGRNYLRNPRTVLIRTLRWLERLEAGEMPAAADETFRNTPLKTIGHSS